MNGSGRKKKGSNRELFYSKKLSEWSGERVMRTLSSGAGGTRAVDEIRMTGDLFFPLGSPNCFSYEAKDHASTRLKHVFNNNGDIPSFWEQAVTDARRLKKFGVCPVLLFHISREDDYVLLPYQQEMYINLLKASPKVPVQLQMTSFTDKMRQQDNNFMTILTNLKGLFTQPPLKVFALYSGLDYDILNKTDEAHTTDLSELVGDALREDILNDKIK